MYTVQSSGALLKARRAVTSGRVSRTVLLLGACSLLTDISSEMVATVLPIYLVSTLGFSPLQLDRDRDYGGVVDNQLRTLEHIGVFEGSLPRRGGDRPTPRRCRT